MKKNILRGWIPTVGLVIAMAFNTFANGGITISGVAGEPTNPCTEKVDEGITINGLGGITISGFGGITISGLVTTVKGIFTTTNCGITISG